MAAVVNDQQHAASGPPGSRARQCLRRRIRRRQRRIEFGASRFPVSGAGCSARRDGPGPLRLRAGLRRSTSTPASRVSEEMGIDLRAEVFDGRRTDLERIDRSQPALFTVEYALAKLVESYGVRAERLSATASANTSRPPWPGCSTSPTAIKAGGPARTPDARVPRGLMVAVALSPDASPNTFPPEVDSPRSTTRATASSRDRRSIRTFTQRLARGGHRGAAGPHHPCIPFQPMDPVTPEFGQLPVRPDASCQPQIPAFSNLTGTWMTDERGRPIPPVGTPNTANGPVCR